MITESLPRGELSWWRERSRPRARPSRAAEAGTLLKMALPHRQSLNRPSFPAQHGDQKAGLTAGQIQGPRHMAATG